MTGAWEQIGLNGLRMFAPHATRIFFGQRDKKEAAIDINRIEHGFLLISSHILRILQRCSHTNLPVVAG